MRSPLPFLAPAMILAAVTSVACQKAAVVEEKKDTPPAAARSSSMPETAAYDVRFIDAMSNHHGDAIEMTSMAQSKLEHAGLEELAKKIPVDQQKEIEQMKSWRDQWYPGAPVVVDAALPGMGAGMDMDMSHMQSMEPGRGYDVMFIDMMVSHHEKAVAMSRVALVSAEHQEIKTLAQQIIDQQTLEIDQMKAWKASL